MLDLGKLDVDEIAMALSDQTDYEHRWLIDPRTGVIFPAAVALVDLRHSHRPFLLCHVPNRTEPTDP